MNHRLAYGILGFLLLLLLAGCTGFGGATSESGLMAEAEYDWETESDAYIELYDSEYKAVYTIENRSSIRVYQSTRYGTEHPVGVRAVQFRHENGTVVDASAIDVTETRSGVTLHLPAENGQLAYTASKRSNQFTTPALIDGSYTVIVPEGHRVDNFVLGTVRPRNAETEIVNDHVHITWERISSESIRVNYYLARNLYLFAGLIVVASIGAMIGLAYVYRQIQELRRRREEMGLDLETDGGRQPPERR